MKHASLHDIDELAIGCFEKAKLLERASQELRAIGQTLALANLRKAFRFDEEGPFLLLPPALPRRARSRTKAARANRIPGETQ